MVRKKIKKYFKPGSVAWLGSFFTLLCGVILASEPLHNWQAIVETIRNTTDIDPKIMILAGLTGIGFRGARG